jgi:putative peptidoglycan lipid II flippase
LLFLQGRFDAAAALATSDVLVVFAIGLAAHAMVAILAPAFYAGKDTRTPVLAAILAVAVNVAVAVVAVGPLGLRGLALAITLGAWFELAVLLVLLERRVPAVRLGALGRGVAAFLPGAVAASVTAYLALQVIDGHAAVDATKVELAVQLAIAGVAAALVFGAYAALLRLEELRTLRLIVGELFTRSSRSPDGA